MSKKKLIIKIIFIITILIIISSIFINICIINNAENKLYTADNAPNMQVWLILWAWVIQNNTKLSDVYKDRVDTAISLYKSWKIKKILVSWDNGDKRYNEVEPARDYLIDSWINSDDIFLDYAGFRTYDSLYRARDVFKVKKVNIITQEFHLPRAIYLCEKMWLKCVWTKADLHKYIAEDRNNFREFFARVKSFIDIAIDKKPKFLGPEVNINWESNAFKTSS